MLTIAVVGLAIFYYGGLIYLAHKYSEGVLELTKNDELPKE